MSKSRKKIKVEDFPCRVCGDRAVMDVLIGSAELPCGSYCDSHAPKICLLRSVQV